jgi:hypothetical protein
LERVTRRRRIGLWAALAPTLVLAIVLVVLVLTTPRPLSPSLPPNSGPALEFRPSGTSYVGDRFWYNFTVTTYWENLTWQKLRFVVTPGPLTRSEMNWSLMAMSPDSSAGVVFTNTAGNWSSADDSSVSSGAVLVLVTDSSLALGSVSALWPGGSYGFELG